MPNNRYFTTKFQITSLNNLLIVKKYILKDKNWSRDLRRTLSIIILNIIYHRSTTVLGFVINKLISFKTPNILTTWGCHQISLHQNRFLKISHFLIPLHKGLLLYCHIHLKSYKIQIKSTRKSCNETRLLWRTLKMEAFEWVELNPSWIAIQLRGNINLSLLKHKIPLILTTCPHSQLVMALNRQTH